MIHLSSEDKYLVEGQMVSATVLGLSADVDLNADGGSAGSRQPLDGLPDWNC